MQKRKINKRIVIISCNDDSSTNPTIVEFCKAAVKRGCQILLVAPGSLHAINVVAMTTNIKHLRVDVSFNLSRKPWVIIRRIWGIILSEIALLYFKPSNIIAIDPSGLISASLLSRLINKCTFGYFSFEIFFMNELKTRIGHHRKIREIKASQKLDFYVVQDDVRQTHLINENHLPNGLKYFKIPVSPIKSAALQTTRVRRCLESGPRVVFSGSLDKWSGVFDILNQAESLNRSGIELELHSRFRLSRSNPIRHKILSLKQKGFQVSLNDEPFSFEELYKYLAAFDLGVVTYVPDYKIGGYVGTNIKDIGLSSGKFSTMMMLGIPVITNDIGSYRMLNKKYCFGEVIDNFDMLAAAIMRVYSRLNEHSIGASSLYSEQLDPRPGLSELLDFLI